MRNEDEDTQIKRGERNKIKGDFENGEASIKE